MRRLLQIRPEDTVAVALGPIEKGEELEYAPGKMVRVKEDIRQGHKSH